MTEQIFPPRDDFPLIVNRDSIAYLDNAASTQKPRAVLEQLDTYYRTNNANVHRGLHTLSDEATSLFEQSRNKVADFIGASSEEIIWTRGTTESINLVASSYAPTVLGTNTTVLISEMEHHSNIVPWQMACEKTGATLRAIKVTPRGELDLDHYRELLREEIKIVSLTHISNVLGTINPIAEIIAMAHDVGAQVVIDGAQAAAHENIDVRALDCDFYAFSGHKMYGPTGIGVLYGKYDLLESMPPWQGGGEMIEHVTLEKTTYQKPPFRFEAGTPDISGAIALGSAIDYLRDLPADQLHSYEQGLLAYATSSLQQIEGLTIIGQSDNKCPIVSFIIDEVHPHDVGTLLDQQHVAVRAGHHCALPLMQVLSIPGTVRASFGLYNSKEEIDRLAKAIQTARKLLTP